ncbi:MAG: hypothetical protein M0Q24_04370 [Sulfurimonas sp.]|uniref:hypothetical protein n=1 Tax=Sulfurimonas sp. TaxID=2022749 RepID=UPI0025E9F2E9|nr:hypothetical protein [Sulfurimonas sp.]MCK9491302.1 hypothetical protein [Sulfurimonas sp.]
MNKIEKIKRVVLIALGFGLATYLIMSGMAMLEQEDKASLVSESNSTSEVHGHTVK